MQLIALGFFILAAGVASSVQAIVNSEVGRRTDPITAATVSFIGGLAVLLVVGAISGKMQLAAAAQLPPLLLTGGLFGVLIVTGFATVVPVLGVTETTLIYILGSLAAALALSSTLLAEDAAITAKLAKIPAPAAEALRKSAGSAKIESVSTEKDGKTTIYEIELTEPGRPNRESSVTADGKIFAEEETVPLEKTPEPVRKAIEAGAKGAKIDQRTGHAAASPLGGLGVLCVRWSLLIVA
jgi:uncharacterized membrane protein YdcZ (DUF606 family)